MVKPGVGQIQTEGVFPIESASNGIGCLPIRQVLHELEDCDQCQAPRGLGGLAVSRKQISKLLIGINTAKCIT